MKRFFLALISVLVALGAAEGVLRLLDMNAIQPHNKEGYQFPCYTKGDFYWLSLKRSSTCILHSTSDAFTPTEVKTNSLGLRNPEIAIPKPRETTRILVLGDSFTMGMGVSEDKAFPRLIASRLTSDKPVEVINAGLPTADMSYYYLFLKNLSARIQPDIIIIGFYPYNDVHDEEILPYNTRVDERGLPTYVDSTTAYADYTGAIFSKRLPAFMKLPVIRNLELGNLLGFLITRIPGIGNVTRSPLVNPQVCIFDPSCHRFDDDKERAKKLFLAIRDMTRINKQRFLVTLIPAELQIYDTARYKVNIPTPLSPSQKRYLNTQWTEFFDANDISSLDLLTVFLAAPSPRTYFEGDTHWNEIGHELAAQTIIDALLPFLSP